MEPNSAVDTSSKVDSLIIVVSLKNKLLDILLVNILALLKEHMFSAIKR